MSRANTLQTNFTTGEISPLMYGRVDTTKYFNGAKKLTNMMVLPQGGAFRRPGSLYYGSTKNDSYCVLKKFIPDSFTSFTLEFTDQVIRLWQSAGIVGSDIASPYLEADLPYICMAQSADVAYITCPGHPPYKLSYSGGFSFTLAKVTFNDGPYLDADPTTNNRIKIAVTSDISTLTSNATGPLNAVASSAIFAGGDVGKYVEYIKYRSKTGTITWGLTIVTANTSTTVDAVTIQTNIIDPGFGNTITFSGGNVHSTNLIFNASSVGKFVRLTGSQAWYQITAFSSGAQCAATALTIVSYNTSTVTVSLASSFAVGDVGKYIDYKVNGQWGLSQILTFVSNTNITVDVIDQILIPDKTAQINVVAGAFNTTSSQSGTFPTTSVGKYVRDSSSQTWGKITAVNGAGDKCTTTVLTMFSYTYPTLIMTLLNDRVITVQVDSRDSIFDPSNSVGISYRFKFGSQWRDVLVTAIVSPTSLVGTMTNYLPWDDSDATNPYNGGYADLYRLPAWNEANGYPNACSFHAGRLWFGGSIAQPTNLWSTETDDFESFTPSDQFTGDVLDTNAITLTIASAEISTVRWIKSGPVLLVGTESNEYQVKPNSLLQAISPTNVVVVPQTSFGCTITQNNSLRIGSSVIFAQAGGGKLREMTYDFNTDAYVSKDISIMSEHLFRNTLSFIFGSVRSQGVVMMDVCTNPFTVGMLVMTDGTIVAMTYDRDQDVIAFHQHKIGATNNTQAIVESLVVVPNIKSGSDQIWLSVKRTINGSTKRFIEQISLVESIKALPGATVRYVDSYSFVLTTGAITNSVGWDRFQGATVQVVVDGVYIGTKVVSSVSGGIGFALNMTVASYVMVGFECDGYIELIDPEGGSQAGTSQAKKKRVCKTAIRVMNSPHPKIGASAGATNAEQTVSSIDTPVTFTRILTPAAGVAPTFYSGDIDITSDDGFNSGGRLAVIQDEPYPFNVLGVFHKLDTNE